MTPSSAVVRHIGALQPESDALEVGKIPSGTEKVDKKAIVHCL